MNPQTQQNLTENEPLEDELAVDSPNSASHQLTSAQPKAKRRRPRGKIARLDKADRDRVNFMLRDGVPYATSLASSTPLRAPLAKPSTSKSTARPPPEPVPPSSSVSTPTASLANANTNSCSRKSKTSSTSNWHDPIRIRPTRRPAHHRPTPNPKPNHDEANPRSEIRNNAENPKKQISQTNDAPRLPILPTSPFRICFGFRYSDFGFTAPDIRISDLAPWIFGFRTFCPIFHLPFSIFNACPTPLNTEY